MRTPIVAGNWKMYKTAPEAAVLAAGVRREMAAVEGVDAVVCPPFTALSAVREALAGSPVRWGAQTMHGEKEGAFTGEISARMLVEAGCRYVILGHSERRAYFGETDEAVNRKARAALEAGLVPIVCVGEQLAQRDAGETERVVKSQITGSLAGLGAALAGVVVAYEPVWAIGTGRTATPAQAQAVHAHIRGVLADMAGTAVSDVVRIQYGGSVKPANAAELFGQPDIDGGLIGGASLEAASFVSIVKAAAPARR